MSISKVAWTVGVLSMLSLGGCALDATEVEGDAAPVGVVTWDLKELAAAGSVDDDEGVDDDDGVIDEGEAEETPELYDDIDGEEHDPYERSHAVTGPNPDPWLPIGAAREETGNKD